MLQKFIDRIANAVIAKLKTTNQPDSVKSIILNSANTKLLSETGVIITYYISVRGMSRAMAEQMIKQLMSDYIITNEEREKMGIKFIKEIWLPIGEGSCGDTRVEITTI